MKSIYEITGKRFTKFGYFKEMKEASIFKNKIDDQTMYVLAVGIVGEIIQGDEYDLVGIKVLYKTSKHSYYCYVKDTQARKQIYALKIGQFVQAFGFMYNNSPYIYTMAFWQVYVPLAFDRKISYRENSNAFKTLKENKELMEKVDTWFNDIRKEK